MTEPDAPPPTPIARWTERYAHPGYVYGETANDFLREQAHMLPPGPVICLADGEGRNGVWLAERGHPVTSVDFAPTATSKARKLAARRGVHIEALTVDLAAYDIAPGAWAGVVWIFCHLPPAVRDRALAGAVAGLAPGGVMILEAYTPDQIGRGTGGPPSADLMLSEALLRPAFAGLEVTLLAEREREVVEGTLHTGRASVVQAVARRPR